MLRSLCAAFIAASALFLGACSTTDPSNEPTMQMTTQLSNDRVTSTVSKESGQVQGGVFVDSLRVLKVRILISRIKMHRADEDTTGGKDVKTGPVVLSFTRDTIYTAFASAIPTGRYDKIKLEMHKFSASEARQWEGDSIFGPFAAPERITLIIDGVVYINGEAKNFQWVDDDTANLWVLFDPYVEVSASSTTNVVMNFDPVEAFRVSGRILNPLDITSKTILRGRMHSAFRCHRK